MKNRILNIYERIDSDLIIYYLSFVYIFGIVFQNITKIPLTFGIVFTTFFWLIKPNYSQKWKLLKINKSHLALVVFYFIMLISAFWSENSHNFGRLIQLKLSLLLTTLVWSSTLLTQKQIHRLLLFFISIFAIHLCIDHLYSFISNHAYDAHECSIVTPNRKHYLGLLTLFSFGISAFLAIKSISKKRILYIIFSLFFVYNVFYIGARIHLVSLIIMSIWLFGLMVKSKLKTKHVVLSISTIICIGTGFFFGSERLQYKVNETKDEIIKMFDDKHEKNMNPRMYIWPSSIEVIKDNFWLGCGLGDGQDELNKKTDLVETLFWIDGANTKLSDKNINSHSQYFEIMTQTGFIGLLIFLLALFYSFKQRNAMTSVILIAVCFSMLTESILERQMGVVFFAFFFSLLSQTHQNKVDSSKI
ncbi:MAG: O-antigen ligase family protein [Flavobacteriales bacterium]